MQLNFTEKWKRIDRKSVQKWQNKGILLFTEKVAIIKNIKRYPALSRKIKKTSKNSLTASPTSILLPNMLREIESLWQETKTLGIMKLLNSYLHFWLEQSFLYKFDKSFICLWFSICINFLLFWKWKTVIDQILSQSNLKTRPSVTCIIDGHGQKIAH